MDERISVPWSGAAAGDFDQLCRLAEPFFTHDDPGHDWGHIQRVLAWADGIGQVEGADLGVLRPAAVLHDLVNVPKNHPDRARASRLAAEAAVPVLVQAGYGAETIVPIRQVIVEHSVSLGCAPSSLEAACLQDADRLDALGAIGLMRAVTCGVRMGSRFYDPADPFAEARPLDDGRFILDHVSNKLRGLPDRMNTALARREAQRRLVLLEQLVDQLASEIAPAHPGPRR